MLWLIVIGVLSGIVGGMGMGGGTLLVPLLSLLDIPQLTVQGINLVSFVPMCVVALIVHGKGGRIKLQYVWYILPSALLSAVVGAIVAQHIQGEVLHIMYGVMLLAVGVWQLVVAVGSNSSPARYVVLYCPSGALRAKHTKYRR